MGAPPLHRPTHRTHTCQGHEKVPKECPQARDDAADMHREAIGHAAEANSHPPFCAGSTAPPCTHFVLFTSTMSSKSSLRCCSTVCGHSEALWAAARPVKPAAAHGAQLAKARRF